MSIIARCIERKHLPLKLALLCYAYVKGSNYVSQQHVVLHQRSEMILMEEFYAAKREAARLQAEVEDYHFEDHDTPAPKKKVVIDLTADSSDDHETPVQKKRKHKTDEKTNKKFTIVIKNDGEVIRTLNFM